MTRALVACLLWIVATALAPAATIQFGGAFKASGSAICPMGSSYADGCAANPQTGRVYLSSCLGTYNGSVWAGGTCQQSGQTYAAIPPYNAAGINYPVGSNPATATLSAAVNANLPAGCTYASTTVTNITTNTVTCSGHTDFDFEHLDFTKDALGQPTCIRLAISSSVTGGTVTVNDAHFFNGPTCDSSGSVNTVNLISNASATGATENLVLTNVDMDGGGQSMVNDQLDGSIGLPTTTASSTSASGAVIHLNSVHNMFVGMYVYDNTTGGAIPSGAKVASIAGLDVTLSASLTGTVSSGDTIQYGGQILGTLTPSVTTTTAAYTLPSVNSSNFVQITNTGANKISFNMTQSAGVTATVDNTGTSNAEGSVYPGQTVTAGMYGNQTSQSYIALIASGGSSTATVTQFQPARGWFSFMPYLVSWYGKGTITYNYDSCYNPTGRCIGPNTTGDVNLDNSLFADDFGNTGHGEFWIANTNPTTQTSVTVGVSGSTSTLTPSTGTWTTNTPFAVSACTPACDSLIKTNQTYFVLVNTSGTFTFTAGAPGGAAVNDTAGSITSVSLIYTAPPYPNFTTSNVTFIEDSTVTNAAVTALNSWTEFSSAAWNTWTTELNTEISNKNVVSLNITGIGSPADGATMTFTCVDATNVACTNGTTSTFTIRNSPSLSTDIQRGANGNITASNMIAFFNSYIDPNNLSSQFAYYEPQFVPSQINIVGPVQKIKLAGIGSIGTATTSNLESAGTAYTGTWSHNFRDPSGASGCVIDGNVGAGYASVISNNLWPPGSGAGPTSNGDVNMVAGPTADAYIDNGACAGRHSSYP